MEKLLRYLLLIPRRIYDIFLRIKEYFNQGDALLKLKVIALIILGLFILIPLAAFGFMLFLSLLAISFLFSLFSPRRKGPPNLY